MTYSLKKDKNLICYGLGVTDPKGVFGTTLNLHKKFGNERVFDVLTSENALTGVSIFGAALNGVRSVVTHQTLDFFLLAMDQLRMLQNGIICLVLKYLFLITIRLIIGRGWGQGPTHSQKSSSMVQSTS